MESSDHTFPRAERLRSRKQIARLFEKGESGVVYPIRYVFLTGEDDAGDATDEGGLSVLVSSHILQEMQLMCDTVGIINNGELLQVASKIGRASCRERV